MTTVRSFQFKSVEHETKRGGIVTEIKVLEADGTETVQKFDLRTDLTGIELLEYIANASPGPGSTRGVALFLRRVVREEDWERFMKANEGAHPNELGDMVGDLIDAYSAFPTTRDAGSSNGSSTTGSTSEPS